MTILESISKEISKKPTQRAWNKLCALFEQGTEEDHKQGLEMIAPKISKWKKSLTLELAVHASDPVHPLLPHVEKASITVDGLSEVPQALATALVKSVLKVLTLTGCEKLTNVQALASAKKLRQLDIIWARNLGDLSGLEHLKSLRKLSIIGSYKLSDLSILQNLKHLTYLNLTEGKFNDLQGLKTLSQIKILHVPNCRMLRSLEGIQE